MLDASQAAMALPLTMTASDPSSFQATLEQLPLVPTTTIDPSSNINVSAPLPSATTAEAGSPNLPSSSSLLQADSTMTSSAPIAPVTLALTSALESYASSVSTAIRSDPGSGSAIVAAPGSGTDSGSSPGATADPNAPVVWTKTVTDAAGGTKTESETYTPNPDGTFTFDLSFSYSTGAVSDPGSTAPTNGASESFDFSIIDTATSITISVKETGKDSYNINNTLSGGTNNGSWKDSGTDSSNHSDSVTLNTDGTTSETYSDGAHSTEKFNLNDTGTASDGGTFTYNDGGNSHDDYTDSGGTAADGTVTNTHDQKDFGTETASIGETGAGNLKVSGSTTDTKTYGDSLPLAQAGSGPAVDTVKTTDEESDSSNYSDSGVINGAAYTVSDVRFDTNNDTNTTEPPSASGITDHDEDSGTNSDTYKLTLTGLAGPSGLGPSSVGTGSDSSAGGTLTENNTDNGRYSGTTDYNGQTVVGDENKTSDTVTASESGVGSDGAFNVSGGGTESDDILGAFVPGQGLTTTSDTRTATPSNETVTGTIPGDGYNDSAILSTEAYAGLQAALGSANAVVANVTMVPSQDDSANPAGVQTANANPTAGVALAAAPKPPAPAPTPGVTPLGSPQQYTTQPSWDQTLEDKNLRCHACHG